ncbi:hypothetical protein E3N86_00225 [Cryobacterium sp. Hz7]|nr:hypothetical protein E3N86_00225 [Cryobacterium sp. Hz7]
MAKTEAAGRFSPSSSKISVEFVRAPGGGLQHRPQPAVHSPWPAAGGPQPVARGPQPRLPQSTRSWREMISSRPGPTPIAEMRAPLIFSIAST